MNSLDWDDLRIFLSVCRCRSISRAAVELGTTEATVSRRMTRLEQRLKLALFERRSSGMVLTDIGRDVLQHATAAEAALQRLPGQQAAADARPVRIATMEGFASLYLAERLLATAHAENLQLELLTTHSMLSVNLREADLAISFAQPQARNACVEEIGQYTLGLFARHDWPQRDAIHSREDLQELPFVSYIDSVVANATTLWLSELVDTPQISFRSNSLKVQLIAAEQGVGLIVAPHFAARHHPMLQELLPDSVHLRRSIWLSAHEDLRFVGPVAAAMAAIKQTVEADCAILSPNDYKSANCGRQ